MVMATFMWALSLFVTNQKLNVNYKSSYVSKYDIWTATASLKSEGLFSARQILALSESSADSSRLGCATRLKVEVTCNVTDGGGRGGNGLR